MKINPYLYFDGNCQEAFDFYSQALNAPINFKMTYEQSPDGNTCGLDKDKIMHISMPIGNNIIMASDVPSDKLVTGNNNFVCLTPDSVEDAEQIFKDLSQDGKICMPMEETFWAERFGMVTDKFGISWMVNLDKKMDIPS